jgi:hypothetical protein
LSRSVFVVDLEITLAGNAFLFVDLDQCVIDLLAYLSASRFHLLKLFFKLAKVALACSN